MAVSDICLNRIGIIRIHGFVHKLCQSGAIRQMRISPPGTIRPFFRWPREEVSKRCKSFSSHIRRFITQRKPAFFTYGAQKGIDDINRTANMKRVRIAGCHPSGMPDNRGFCIHQFPDKRFDFACRNAGFRFGPLRRIGFDKCFKLVQIFDPQMGIGMIIRVPRQQFMNDRQIKGIIRTWPDHQKPVGFGGRNTGPNVDYSQFAAIFHGIHQIVDFLNIYGFENIPELQHYMPGIFKIIHQFLSAEAGK